MNAVFSRRRRDENQPPPPKPCPNEPKPPRETCAEEASATWLDPLLLESLSPLENPQRPEPLPPLPPPLERRVVHSLVCGWPAMVGVSAPGCGQLCCRGISA